MLKMSFNFMSMNSIPLFFYESSISKKINMTSRQFLKKNATNNAQKMHLISKVQFKNIKVQLIKIGRVLDSSVDVSKS